MAVSERRARLAPHTTAKANSAWDQMLVFSRLYVVISLVVVAVLTTPFYSWLAIALLLLELYCVYNPPRATLNIGLVLSILLLLPLMFEPVIGGLAAPLMLIPGLPILDNALKRQSHNRVSRFSLGTRSTTTTKAIVAALAAMVFVSVIALSPTLALSSGIIACYFIGVLIYFLVKAGRAPLESSEIEIRTIAGESAEASANIKSKVPMPMGISFGTPFPWAALDPDTSTIDGKTVVNVTARPLLSGPTQVPIQASVVDPWGLVEIGQEIGPIELHVIPRAKYAEWLAKKFLEQSAPEGATPFTITAPVAATKRSGGRVEYYGSREYRPGDRLKDINWKQSLKLTDLVVKDYSEPQRQQGILLANLTATDAEEADIVISTLISSAVTMAKQYLVTVLAAYNQQEVLTITRPLSPRDVVKKALGLAEEVATIEHTQRFLAPQELRKLRRTIAQLEKVGNEPSQRLSNILSMEYAAMQETAKAHPLSTMFWDTTRHVPPPAAVTVVSSWNHDIEALSVMEERLRLAGYDVVHALAGPQARPLSHRAYS